MKKTSSQFGTLDETGVLTLNCQLNTALATKFHTRQVSPLKFVTLTLTTVGANKTSQLFIGMARGMA